MFSRSSFLWKLYLSYAVLIVTTAITVSLLIESRIAEDSKIEIGRSLDVRARLIGDVVALADRSSLQQRIREQGRVIDTRITVITAEGNVLADSQRDPVQMDNHGDRPEVQEAMERGYGSAVRYSETIGHDMMYVARRMPLEGPIKGVVRTSIAFDVVEKKLAKLRTLVILGASLASVGALVLGLLVAGRVTAPLIAITKSIEALMAGKTTQKVSMTSRDEVGTLARAFNTMFDELEQRIETTTQERNKLAAIIGGMIEGVVAIDAEERIVHMNDVAGRLLRANPEASRGRPIWEVCRGRSLSAVFSRALDSTDIRTDEIGSDGDMSLEVHTAPLRDGGGDIVGAVVVIHDVTEIKHLSVVRRDFVANVSHELKTPITAIRGLAETMVDDSDMNPDTRNRFLVKIKNQAARLSSLVSDLLTLARLESDRADKEVFHELDYREVIRAAHRALGAASEAKDVDIDLDLPDQRVPILGDEEGLRQLATNLIDNAVKYTPKSGQVRVALQVEGSDSILEVQDNGVGIDFKNQERIFERFYRVDKARSRELGGTGLGLSIVKHVSLAHGGDVGVESALGQGTLFRVTIPLAPPPAEDSGESDRPA